MPSRALGFPAIVNIGLALPGVEFGSAYGGPALKAGGRLMAAMATNKSAEADSLCVCVDFADRDELLAADPSTYYITPHYAD